MNASSHPQPMSVDQLDAESRGLFVVRTYGHLFSAIVAFTLLEVYLFSTGLAKPMAEAMLSVSWLWVLGGFVVVSWIARGVAHKVSSKAAQYAALAGYIAAEAVIFVPLLDVADELAPGVISSAATVTLFGATGLSLVVFYTRKDFSFLHGILWWGGVVALVLIVAGVIFGFELGTFFSVAMIALAGASILYDTSNI